MKGRFAISTLNKPEGQTQLKERRILNKVLLRLWPFLIVLGIVLFPFDWLAQVWPAYRQVFLRVFTTEREHLIGHSTLFFLLGLCTLIALPVLRLRALLYFGLMFLAALGEEALQNLFKQELPNLGDGRDIVFDLLGVVVVFVVIWVWQWAQHRRQQA